MIPILTDPGTAGFPEAQADRCVKCGLCLPQCPTYTLSREEAESPRGRIGLMQALAGSDDAPSAALVKHLEQCLACRRCEAVCPAQVPYGRLIDAARAELARRGHRAALAERLLARLVTRPRLWQSLRALLRAAVRLRLVAFAACLAPRSLRAAADWLPARADPGVSAPAAAAGSDASTVALFTGCMGPLFEPDALRASRRLLEAAGYRVVVPPRQVCCGALPLHAGQPAAAAPLMHRNVREFARHAPAAIACTASGCGATLREYGQLIGAGEFGDQVHDVMRLLAGSEYAPTAPEGIRIGVHAPCTQVNVVGEHDATATMLRRSGAQWLPLPGNSTCCGAAGTYLMRQPALAARLREPKLDAIIAAGLSTVVTTNVGCAMHLRAGLRQRGVDIPVLHPATLLDGWIPGESAARVDL